MNIIHCTDHAETVAGFGVAGGDTAFKKTVSRLRPLISLDSECFTTGF